MWAVPPLAGGAITVAYADIRLKKGLTLTTQEI